MGWEEEADALEAAQKRIEEEARHKQQMEELRQAKLAYPAPPFGSGEKRFFLSPWMSSCISDTAKHDACDDGIQKDPWKKCSACTLAPGTYTVLQDHGFSDPRITNPRAWRIAAKACASPTFSKSSRTAQWRFDGTAWSDVKDMAARPPACAALTQDRMSWELCANQASAAIHSRVGRPAEIPSVGGSVAELPERLENLSSAPVNAYTDGIINATSMATDASGQPKPPRKYKDFQFQRTLRSTTPRNICDEPYSVKPSDDKHNTAELGELDCTRTHELNFWQRKRGCVSSFASAAPRPWLNDLLPAQQGREPMRSKSCDSTLMERSGAPDPTQYLRKKPAPYVSRMRLSTKGIAAQRRQAQRPIRPSIPKFAAMLPPLLGGTRTTQQAIPKGVPGEETISMQSVVDNLCAFTEPAAFRDVRVPGKTHAPVARVHRQLEMQKSMWLPDPTALKPKDKAKAPNDTVPAARIKPAKRSKQHRGEELHMHVTDQQRLKQDRAKNSDEWHAIGANFWGVQDAVRGGCVRPIISYCTRNYGKCECKECRAEVKRGCQKRGGDLFAFFGNDTDAEGDTLHRADEDAEANTMHRPDEGADASTLLHPVACPNIDMDAGPTEGRFTSNAAKQSSDSMCMDPEAVRVLAEPEAAHVLATSTSGSVAVACFDDWGD